MILGPKPSTTAVSRGGWRSRIPTVLAGLLALVAILAALSAVGLAFRQRTAQVRGLFETFLIPAPANLAYAALLAIFAGGVARRKRAAWWVLVVYLAVNLLRYIGLGRARHLPPSTVPLAVVAAVTTIGFLVLLFIGRRQFYARVRRGNLWQALAVLVGAMAAFSLLGWGLLELFPGSLAVGERFEYAVSRVLGGAFQLEFRHHGGAPAWIDLLLGGFGAVALFASVLALFRSQRRAAVMSTDAEVRLRELLHRYGDNDSLGYFATRRDKSVVFAPGGGAAVTYRAVAGVCLASADPIGDPADWPKAIEAWLEHARGHGWVPGVLGASESGAGAYARAGLRVREIGDEAIVAPRDFTLRGQRMRPVRQAVSHVERLGYTVRIRRHGELSDQDMASAVRNADKWRDTDFERGFSMALSRLGDVNDGENLLVEAVDVHRRVRAMLSFVPWGGDGLSLELARRSRDSANGLMEFMVTSLCREARDLGVQRISLNFATFREVFEAGGRMGAGPVLRFWRRLLLFFSRWWQMESLYRSNVKYAPYWVPRYLCYGERRMLGRVGVAAGIAEGILTTPRRRRSIGAGTRSTPLPGLSRRPAPVEPPTPERDRDEQSRIRVGKLERLRDKGIDPYPADWARGDTCGEIIAAHRDAAPDTRTGDQVRLAGRVMLLRHHARLSFATVRDWSGDLQVMVAADPRFKDTIDIGDHIGVAGEVITSRTGELSVSAEEWRLLAKCLHPLPNKHRGLTDPEAKLRDRHLDLICEPAARARLRLRGTAVAALRQELSDRGFLEVETPILQPATSPGARSFTTSLNVYHQRMYLRIAPELYLKRLCVGGVERLFELGRSFRNEGISGKHHPEFTLLEAYQAYSDFEAMRELTTALIQTAARKALGGTVIRHGGTEYDLAGSWPVRPVYEAVSEALDTRIDPQTDVERLRRLCETADLDCDPRWGCGDIVVELYERLVEATTTTPTYYTGFPTEVCPLTRPSRADPAIADRWDLVAFGTELGTAYTELTDPIEQRRRFNAQLRGAGPEADLDEEFLTALEYGMPPTGGLGLGVDRIVMLLTGGNIRETLAFPLVRNDSSATRRNG